MKFSLLLTMKMSTFVGIFIFISRENFMLSCVKHEKSFITSGPVFDIHMNWETNCMKCPIFLKENNCLC